MLRTSLRARLMLLGGLLLVVGVVVGLSLRSTGDEDALTGLTGECADLHEGHDLMGWDTTQADEMTASACGWPYEPFLVSDEGGEVDPALDAPFEPHPYAELWTAMNEADLGVCAIASMPEEPGDGFVFGFRYEGAEPGCPTATTTVELVAREHVTRAHRDAAAHALDDGEVYVLGRWSLQLVAVDEAGADRLADQLVQLGAIVLPAS